MMNTVYMLAYKKTNLFITHTRAAHVITIYDYTYFVLLFVSFILCILSLLDVMDEFGEERKVIGVLYYWL